MENKFEFEELKFSPTDNRITYIATDGAKFKDKLKFEMHQSNLTWQRKFWFDKRYSIFWMLMYFFFKKEPKKPYKF